METFRKRVKTAARRAGFPRVSAYSLRHAFASQRKAGGTGIEDLAATLGHSVDATQQQYGHARQGQSGGGLSLQAVETAQPIKATAQAPLGSHQDQASGPKPGRGGK